MRAVRGILGVIRAPFLALPVTLVAAGTAAAAYEGSWSPVRAGLALVGLLALHAAVNTLNEISDHRRGIDLETRRTPFSGGSGTLPEGRLPVGAAWAVAGISLAVGAAVGVWFLVQVGGPLVPVLVVGAVCVIGYSDALARAGLGELAAGLGLGALPVYATALVQAGHAGPAAAAASVPAFLTTFDLLLLNEFPDEAADRRGGRRNLVLALGRRRAALVYAAVALAVPAWIGVAVASGRLPWPALLGAVPSTLLVGPLRWAFVAPEAPVPVPALAANVGWNLATNLALAAGLAAAALV